MTDRRARLERRISEIPVPPPPAGLAERIKRDIPERLPATGAESLTELSPYRIWLRVAAILLVVVSSSFVAMQLLVRDSRPTPVQTADVPLADMDRSADIAAPPPPAIPVMESQGDLARTNVKAMVKPDLRDEDSPSASEPLELQKRQSRSAKAVVPSAGADEYGAKKSERARMNAADSNASSLPTPSIDQIASETEAKETAKDITEQTVSYQETLHSDRVVAGVIGGVIGGNEPAPAAPAVAQAQRESSAQPSMAPKQAVSGPARRADEKKLGTGIPYDYRSGSFVDAEEKPASSFPLNVGSESYLTARSQLRKRRLPTPDSVHSEEFVNYFRYGDPAPRRGDFALAAEGSMPPFPSGLRSRVVRVGVVARPGADIGAATVKVHFNSAVVQRYRLIGFDRGTNQGTAPDPGVKAGHATSDRGATVLYDLKLQPAYRRTDTLATVHLSYRSADNEIVELSRELATGDVEREWLDASRSVQLASIASIFAEVLRGEELTRNIELEMLATRGRVVADRYPGDADVAELVTLIETAARLTKVAPNQ